MLGVEAAKASWGAMTAPVTEVAMNPRRENADEGVLDALSALGGVDGDKASALQLARPARPIR